MSISDGRPQDFAATASSTHHRHASSLPQLRFGGRSNISVPRCAGDCSQSTSAAESSQVTRSSLSGRACYAGVSRTPRPSRRKSTNEGASIPVPEGNERCETSYATGRKYGDSGVTLPKLLAMPQHGEPYRRLPQDAAGRRRARLAVSCAVSRSFTSAPSCGSTNSCSAESRSHLIVQGGSSPRQACPRVANSARAPISSPTWSRDPQLAGTPRRPVRPLRDHAQGGSPIMWPCLPPLPVRRCDAADLPSSRISVPRHNLETGTRGAHRGLWPTSGARSASSSLWHVRSPPRPLPPRSSRPMF